MTEQVIDMPKIHILFRFFRGPWGGGNQFLKALRTIFKEKGVYAKSLEKADVILFNSDKRSLGSLAKELCQLKFKQNKILINRIDGPIQLRNNQLAFLDELIIRINNLLMDGCVYQSRWAYEGMKKLGGGKERSRKIIHNASNKNIFYPSKTEGRYNNDKIKIIATSWSTNYYIKGFDIYEFLDKNLDFSNYEMTFVGRSPIKFKSIKHIKPVPSKVLAEILRQHDIYVTASINDPCSNALIEALQCGLPSVVRNSGGHSELIKNGGVVFNGQDDVLEKIKKLAENLKFYRNNIPIYDIDVVGSKYLDFIEEVFNKQLQASSKLSSYNKRLDCLRLSLIILKYNISSTIKAMMWNVKKYAPKFLNYRRPKIWDRLFVL